MLRRLSRNSSTINTPVVENALARIKNKRNKARQQGGGLEEPNGDGSSCRKGSSHYIMVDDESAWYNLPLGAEDIIRNMAAEVILQELLNKVNDRESVEHDAIAAVVREFPGTCLKAYDFVWEDGSTRNMLPLAIVCCLRPPLETIQAVYDANPQAIFVKESCKNSLPLHLASAFEASLDVVQFVYSKNKSAISLPRNDGVYPIHLACGFYLGEPSVVNFLLDEFPEGASKICSGIRWSPFHSACHGGIPDPDVLDRLCELEPSSLQGLDKHGRTALHLACRSRQGNPQTVDYLVRKQPASLNVEDLLDGWTPLFLASIYQSPKTIGTLLDRITDETRTTNPAGGATLLHWAAIGNSSESVQFLAERFPEMLSAQTTDGAKDTPLSCAIDNDAPMENIRVLIQQFPKALFIKDGVGRRPLLSARSNRARKELIRLLEVSERKHKDLRSRLFW